MTTFTDTIPHLSIEVLPGGLIRLENESMGDSYAVDLHPLHLRHIAEKMGLVESSDPQAQKTIATLQRRLLLLRDRIDHLGEYLALHSDSRHADLSYEQTYATATADIAEEFCTDLIHPVSLSAPDAAHKQTVCEQNADTKASPNTNPRQMAMSV